MTTLSRLFRLVGIALIGLAGLWFFPATAHATVITTCPGGTCSLADLFDGGEIIINDKRFTQWQIFDLDVFATGMPDLSLIEATPIDDPLNPGLQYYTNGQLSITNGSASAFVLLEFGYVMQTLDSVPRIKDNSLELQRFAFSGEGGLIFIDEFVCVSDFFCDPFDPLDNVAIKDVFVDNIDPVASLLFDAASFAPQAELFVENSLFLFNDFEGESVVLDSFEQRWSQVPEPGSFVLLSIGLTITLLLLRCRGAA